MPSKQPNRLIHEKSPYLLQHAYNPVEWFPWGDDAFRKAREENKPIFLSVGYSTCYWCHVMEREVFENEEIARLMNEKLVNIKVDREERPDVDRVYMTAVQAMTGSGGWPMSVFLTPDLKPFYGATYIPPRPQYGRPGFPQLIERINDLWQHERDKVLESSEQIGRFLSAAGQSGSAATIDETILHTAFEQFRDHFDPRNGGFGGAPKFPRPATFNFLLRYFARTGQREPLDMMLQSLRAMAAGGVYDHIGGGFHRYSVDAAWRVPHFEKMLYDQAQLVTSYLDAFQITHDQFFAGVARDVLNYVSTTLTGADGGFFSAEDAESAIDVSKPDQKHEGAFYLWAKSEIEQIIGSNEESELVNFYYGIEEAGNAPHDPSGDFIGRNILYAAHTADETARQFNTAVERVQHVLHNARTILHARRALRPRPHLDDKIITAWNGLMISAFARAYAILGDHQYGDSAKSAAEFAMTRLINPSTGTLFRRYRDGDARFDGGLQDFAFLVMGLIDLYEATANIVWLEHAITLTQKQIEIFWDQETGGFFDTPGNDPSILIRTKEEYDGAEPTGNSIAAMNLLRLSVMTNNPDWRPNAERTIMAFGEKLQRVPESAPQMLCALDWLTSSPREIIIAGSINANDTRLLLREVHSRYLPNAVLLFADGGKGQQFLSRSLPFLKDLHPTDGKPAAYVCRNYACQIPTADPRVLARLLDEQ
jgi:uncharacterized protein YyaL (SSP411 family)